MSLDIAIQVDPGNSVAAANKVTAALHRTEDAGDDVSRALRKTGSEARAAATGLDSCTRALQAEQRALERSSVAAKQASESTKILNQRIRDVGKGAAFAMVAQGFAELKKGLDGVTASAADAAVQGAAVGAAFGGPLGAAIGATAGALRGLVTGLGEADAASKKARAEAEKTAEAYWDQVRALERRARVEGLLGDVTIPLAQQTAAAGQERDAATQVIKSQADALRLARAEAQGWQDALVAAQEQLRAGADGAAGAVRRAERGLRDAKLQADALAHGWSDAFVAAARAEHARADRLDDLASALGTLGLSQASYNKLLGEYNELVKTAEDGTKKLVELRTAVFGGHAFLSLTPTPRNTTDVFSGPRSVASPVAGPDASEAKRIEEMMRDLRGVTMWTDTAAAKTAKWHEKLAKAQEQTRMLAEGFGSIGAEIVNMAMEGEFAIDRLLGSLAKLALQIAAIQIGGPWGTALGAFAGGLGGFASGGSGRVPGGSDPFYLPRAANGLSGRIGGVGGTDSKLFMARVTPGEFFEFRTPQQQARREAAAMPAVNIRPQIVVQSDPREIASAAGSFSVGRQIVRLQRQFNQRR